MFAEGRGTRTRAHEDEKSLAGEIERVKRRPNRRELGRAGLGKTMWRDMQARGARDTLGAINCTRASPS